MKRDGRRSFAFITFKHEESVPYAEAIMENVSLYNRPLRLAARSSNKDFNNNANEVYTPEIYVNDASLHRSSSWHNPPVQQSMPAAPFVASSIPSNGNVHMTHSHSSSTNYSPDDRSISSRFDRRKPNFYHPYHRNEQDYSHMKQRNGNYNHFRRGGGGSGGGGGGGGGYNYHR
jgi:RNA recognition motif-containing protein